MEKKTFTEKDYIIWHEKKRMIQGSDRRLLFKEQEIWFCSLGENIGFEQDGRGKEFLRPVLIFKRFNQETFWGIPLTKQVKVFNQYQYTFTFVPSVTSVAIISQLRFLDAKRLKYKMGRMNEANFFDLKIKIRQLLV
jgi:mRNA-degrading endonuclease toxin of MazEF toxin-antitoxin module